MLDNMRLFEEERIIRREQHYMTAHIRDTVGEPKRGPDATSTELADYARQKERRLEINNDLAACIYCGPNDTLLCLLVEAGQGSARGHCDPVRESVAVARTGAAKMSDAVPHALERIDDVVCEVVLADLPDDADSHTTPLPYVY
jgi:hypothetical protein